MWDTKVRGLGEGGKGGTGKGGKGAWRTEREVELLTRKVFFPPLLFVVSSFNMQHWGGGG